MSFNSIVDYLSLIRWLRDANKPFNSIVDYQANAYQKYAYAVIMLSIL